MASSSFDYAQDDTVAAPRLMTVDQYFQTPETVTPMELIFGAVRAADAPSPFHQSAVLQFCLALVRHVRDRQLGRVWVAPLDVVLDEPQALIVQPDVMFISNEREWIVRDRVRGAPDMVLEVLSPEPRIGSTEDRIGWYAQYGVRECWLVHQTQIHVAVLEFRERRLKERRLSKGWEPIHSSVLPEFTLSLEEIFEE